MASDKASHASGAAQEGDLRRRNVPSQDTNGSVAKSSQETDNKKLQAVGNWDFCDQCPLLIDFP